MTATPDGVPGPDDTPRLGTGCVLRHDPVRQEDHLVVPERIVRLNATCAAALDLCDGNHTLAQIVDLLGGSYSGADIGPDVVGLLAGLRSRGWMRW